MNKETYEIPELELIVFTSDDIITESPMSVEDIYELEKM